MSIKNLIPQRDLVLIEMPDYVDKLQREVGALTVNTLGEIKYYPTQGKLIKLSPELWANGVPMSFGMHSGNTKVYFEKTHWFTAKEAAFDSEDERDKGIDFGHGVYAIKEDDKYYMLLPYRYLYMARFYELNEKKSEGILHDIMLNNYVLCEKIEKEKEIDLGFVKYKKPIPLKIADKSEHDYLTNQVKVKCLPSGVTWIKPGDTVFTLVHCDIPLVEPINNLDESDFIIELENIIAKIDDMKKYVAAPNRIIIKPIEQEQQEGLQIDSTFAQKQTAEVYSVGTGVELKQGDIIVYPFNAGRKNRLPVLPGDDFQLEVIDRDGYFCTIEQ